MKTIAILLLLVCSITATAQDIRGTVYEVNLENNKITLPGANVYWMGTQNGVATDENGEFVLEKNSNTNKLCVSYIGFVPDTIMISEEQEKIEIILVMNRTLKTVVITNESNGFLSRIEPINTFTITGAELHKAACCNLGESFETNASVDVHFSDAITGAKQIQLLGLAGTYTQMMTENISNLYGLARPYGLGYIPGSWMSSIQISKGASSVVDGYSSITGQINTNHKEPDTKEIFYFNALVSDKGKYEGNMNARWKISDKISTILLLHGENTSMKTDNNKDGFMDMPQIGQINVLNKWKYYDTNGMMSKLMLHVIDEQRTGGQMNFVESRDKGTTNYYGTGIHTRRYEIQWKMGKEFNEQNSLAIKTGFYKHNQDSYFGLRVYDANELSANTNIVYQWFSKTDVHKISAGTSFYYDKLDENVKDSNIDTVFSTEEIVPGVFTEYTFKKEHWPTVLIGMRADVHNIYGVFYTPRMHSKYNINEKNILRASIGKGYRTASIFSENTAILATSRQMIFAEEIKQEEAINAGISYSRYIYILGKELLINGDFYHTSFQNQLVLDVDQDINSVYFYNLDGRSYANSYQIEINYEPIKGLDLVLAYRYSDVKTTINNELREKPLVNKYKGLINLSYQTNLKKWQFDFTTQFNGDTRLPSTQQNPLEYQRSDKANAYTIMNAQVTKYFKKWNVYLGVENLGNFTQQNPIVAADDPFGQYFDASMIWGPLVGRKFYLGFRYMIKE